ncbi:hypothetical protein PAXINDRAFT_158152 [Paxillus involutus ATCC 200175]|uniref:Unplaced genomic scaffold PAXINscaffold_312, whole genome shotgun sequence n=1 Tax=Paxillus involutus ATCC 200175 TaxID=664439 RepID=A0A0C9TKP0_PAXIN|nr:hypothetical protein PAXINDRAFT_158152 [Paxillus involutus ATCC 200175]
MHRHPSCSKDLILTALRSQHLTISLSEDVSSGGFQLDLGDMIDAHAQSNDISGRAGTVLVPVWAASPARRVVRAQIQGRVDRRSLIREDSYRMGSRNASARFDCKRLRGDIVPFFFPLVHFVTHVVGWHRLNRSSSLDASLNYGVLRVQHNTTELGVEPRIGFHITKWPCRHGKGHLVRLAGSDANFGSDLVIGTTVLRAYSPQLDSRAAGNRSRKQDP